MNDEIRVTNQTCASSVSSFVLRHSTFIRGFGFRHSSFATEGSPYMPADDILLDCEEHMEKALDHLKHELRGIRTGRASPAMVENVKIEYYGSMTDVKSIASISVPEATQLLIKPFSPGDLHAIEKAISESKIQATPRSDGKT